MKEMVACLFVFRKECQKAAKNVGVTANPISIWAGPALVFTGPQVGDDPHTPTFPWLSLGAGGLASLLAQEILQSQAGAHRSVATKGRYQLGSM